MDSVVYAQIESFDSLRLMKLHMCHLGVCVCVRSIDLVLRAGSFFLSLLFLLVLFYRITFVASKAAQPTELFWQYIC